MKITYDPEAGALYIQLREVTSDDTLEIEEGVIVDLDRNGHIIGIEMLDASKRLTPQDLTNISYQNPLLAAKEVL